MRRCAAQHSEALNVEISTKTSKIKDLRNYPKVLKNGADNGIRVFEPLAITELQVVEKISAHSHATFSSFARKSDVYNPVSF